MENTKGYMLNMYKGLQISLQDELHDVSKYKKLSELCFV